MPTTREAIGLLTKTKNYCNFNSMCKLQTFLVVGEVAKT